MTNVCDIERFMHLFRGYSEAYGSYNASNLGGEGKQPTEQNFLEHINGKQPIGIYPLDNNEKVSFAAIDIDEYPINHVALSEKLNDWKLPFLVCNSKSGGAHIYIFFRKSEEPGMVIQLLKRVSASLGYPKAEIFPKQVNRPSGSYGNFINLPFFGHPSLSYSCWDGDNELGIDGFLNLAEKRLTSFLELEVLIEEAELIEDLSSEEPKAAEVIHASGRNDYLFKFGCQLFRLIKDETILLNQLKSKNLSATAAEHPTLILVGQYLIMN